MIPCDVVPSKVFDALRLIDRPTIVYDTDAIRTEIVGLARNLRQAIGPTRAYSIHQSLKANAHVPLLAYLSQLGLGSEVASMEEFAIAQAIGFPHVCATSPAFRADEIETLSRNGAIVNIDNLQQLESVPTGSSVALRVRVPLPPSGSARNDPFSRFGLDVSDTRLLHMLRTRDHRVNGLHFHFRDIGTKTDLHALVDYALSIFSSFPDVITLNLGGGMTRLHRDPQTAEDAWLSCRKRFDQLPLPVRIVVEPGAQLLTSHGYLGARVLGVKMRADGSRICTIDASCWRLRHWSRTSLVHPRHSSQVPLTDVVGPTCYEDDIWFEAVALPEVAPGNIVIIRGLGAYVTSMLRHMHQSPPPFELLV